MEYQKLYEHYYTMVYRLSLLILKNTHDAEDAAQSIFLKVIEKKPVFTDENHEKAWLLTVTRNYCTDVKRSFWHKKRTDMEQLPEPSAEPFDKQGGLLFEIIQTLPPKQREVIYLYYFEDYSIKEIAALLDRNESTVQSQLFAARKRLKKQFSASKAAVLSLCLIVTLGFGGIAVDAASGGGVRAAIRELLSADQIQVADETISLPIEVYASDLVGINDQYLVLANERGLLIYDRERGTIADVLDLQELDCNYLNADTIATRIFMDGSQLYLFNETINTERPEDDSPELPQFAYIYDLSQLTERNPALSADDTQKLNMESTANTAASDTARLTRTTDTNELQTIYDRWEQVASEQIFDTFDCFQGADFLDANVEKARGTSYSANSLQWASQSGKNMLSCLVVDRDSNYELYSKQLDDGTITHELLNLTVTGNMADDAADASGNHISDDTTTDSNGESSHAAKTNQLPAFSYSGDDQILATLCAYVDELDAGDKYAHEENSVLIPAPIIYGTVPAVDHNNGTSSEIDGDDTATSDSDIYVFCNLWSYWYYRNGNTLTCESGGEAPARLLLHPNPAAATGYEVIEDLRTGDGADYAAGIKEFCKGFPGMTDRYFRSEASEEDNIRTELIRMYVQDNDLDIKYYKDYGWDPVLVQ